MARFQDELPSQQGWIHELAQGELHPDAEKLLQLGKSFDPQQLVEESSIDFLTDLRELLTDFCRIFNAYSESGTRFPEIKLYGIAQSAADFMLFRNQIKLIFMNSAHGVIQMSFSQHNRGGVAVDGLDQHSGAYSHSPPILPSLGPTQELIAQVGAFREIYWSYHGEKVSPEQVARFYFAEFIKLSRDLKRSKAGNQVLLDQIKALLQEKGLDL